MGLAYFAAVLSMIGDWLRVLSKKTKEEVRLIIWVHCYYYYYYSGFSGGLLEMYFIEI